MGSKQSQLREKTIHTLSPKSKHTHKHKRTPTKHKQKKHRKKQKDKSTIKYICYPTTCSCMWGLAFMAKKLVLIIMHLGLPSELCSTSQGVWHASIPPPLTKKGWTKKKKKKRQIIASTHVRLPGCKILMTKAVCVINKKIALACTFLLKNPYQNSAPSSMLFAVQGV